MPFPTILVNSATGSDTAASGAGPSTALTGTTNASFSGATVTLPAGTDLTNVATDGSHVLYLVTSTGVRFFKITAKAGSGGATPTVDVTPNPAGTSTSRTWAIGGKRASIASASSVLLFDQGGSSGDAMPGWTVEMESGHSESLTARFDLWRAGDTTDGPITLRGTFGAGTKPLLSWNTNDIAILIISDYWHLRDFELRNTNGTKTASYGVQPHSSLTRGIILSGLTIAHATNKFWRGINVICPSVTITNCRVGNTASHGLIVGAGVVVSLSYSEFFACGDDAVTGAQFNTINARGNIIRSSVGSGMVLTIPSSINTRVLLDRNTFYDNDSDGVEIASDNDGLEGCVIENNIFSDNGGGGTGYGLNFSVAGVGRISALATIRNNCFFNNATGKYNPSTLNSIDEETTDPTFTNAGSGDFSIGTNLKAQGYPTSAIAGGGTTSYVDIGAAQRQEAASGGGMLRHPGMTGGTNA